ncbi:MAG TPA: hypothetical protein VNP92_16415 [Actinophytocola sp.]|nr:hypothetical protein [Actinophytocola sp.]
MNSRWLRSARLCTAGLFAAAAVVAAASPAAADASCPSGNSCFWTLQQFDGSKQTAGNMWAGQWVWVDAGHRNYHSLKNRFTDRAVWSAKPNQTAYCTPAGGERPTAPEYTVILVGGQNSHC